MHSASADFGGRNAGSARSNLRSNWCSRPIRPRPSGNRCARSCGRFARLMNELDSDRLLPSEVERLRTQLRGELIKLWQTDFIRPTAPTVTLEVHRGLSFQPVLWAAVPQRAPRAPRVAGGDVIPARRSRFHACSALARGWAATATDIRS